MDQEEFDIIVDYVRDAWPKTHDLSSGYTERWRLQLYKFALEDVLFAIDFHKDIKQTPYGPSLEDIISTVEENVQRKINQDDKRKVVMMFEHGPANYQGADKRLAREAMHVCFMLISKSMTAVEAVEYFRDVLPGSDPDNANSYHSMAASIERGIAELRVRQDKAQKFSMTKADIQLQDDYSPSRNLSNWLKEKRQQESEKDS